MAMFRLDHFITAARVENIDSYLEEYRKAGFLVGERTVKHNPGLRNGFIYFGPEYLEFVWVEDERLFEQGADHAMFKPHLRTLRAGYRPFGIGIATDDVRALHDEWVGRGFELPPVIDGWARDSDRSTPPIWSFQPVPSEATAGALCFGLTYHTAPKDAVRKVKIAPNTTYATSGITFVSDEAEARAMSWRDLLAPDAVVSERDGGYQVVVKPHTLRWITPLDYQENYGLSYKPSPHPFGEMAVINVLATDLDVAEEYLAALDRRVSLIPDKATGKDTLLVPPDERDGFALVIAERPAEEWIEGRVAATGERLELEPRS